MKSVNIAVHFIVDMNIKSEEQVTDLNLPVYSLGSAIGKFGRIIYANIRLIVDKTCCVAIYTTWTMHWFSELIMILAMEVRLAFCL